MSDQSNIIMESMLRVGTVLHGTYRIDSYLSSGGFGNTYVATHINFNEKYAIKEFFMKGVNERDGNNTAVSVSNNEKVTEFNEQLEKFKKEARRLRKLNNSHIVRVYDLFEENGTAYYVMDYISGENLKERLKRTGQPLTDDQANQVLIQVLDALNEVHSNGIWHLDLKPANVMINNDGIVKLIDFGASKQFNNKTGGALSTSSVTYTNGFAPIEQMEKSYEKLGPWTDFYALGATLYNVLTNQRPPMPSDINDDHTPDKHLSLPLPSSVSNKTRDMILWLMKTNRKERPASVKEIMDSLKINQSGAKNHHTGETTILQTPITNSTPSASWSAPVAQPEPQPYREEEQYDSENSSSETTKKTKKAIIVAAFVGLLLALGGYYMYNGGFSGSTEEKETVDSVQNQLVTIALGEGHYSGPIDEAGKPNGKGIVVFNNGDKCEASFINGVIKVDTITYSFNDNGDVFVGSIKIDNDVAALYEGKLTKKDGSYFVGSFKDSSPDKGTWYDKKGNPVK